MSTQVNPPGFTSMDPPSDTNGDAQAKVQEVVGRAQDQAQEVAGRTQDRIREQVDQRSTQLGEQIHQHASDLRSVSDALRQQGNDRPAQAADRVAGYAERAGSYLQERDADSLLGDLEDFGREKPAAVAAGALALGFAASRFLKASSSRRYASRGTQRPAPSPSAPVAPPVSPLDGSDDPIVQPPMQAGI